MLRIIFSAFLLAASLSNAFAQSVQQSGSVTPGHATMWNGTGVIKDAGTATNGFLTSLGVTNNGGPGICVSSAVPTAAARNQLCLYVTTNGGAKLSSYSYGTATNAGFTFDVNGVVQGFPTVTLPVLNNDFACFNGTTGDLKDCGGSISGLSVTNHAVAIGTGALGFRSASPGTANFVLTSNGASSDPTFQAVTPAAFGAQTANTVLAGPTSGGASSPTFRALVAADITALPSTVFANPTASIGLTAVNGIATTAMRSDAAPPLSASVQSSLTGTNHGVLLGTGAFGFGATTAGLANQPLIGNGASADASFGTASSNYISFLQTGTGAASWNLQTRLRQTFNIFDYGAVCDGSTDDTTAIQNTITAAGAAALGNKSNGLVYAPPGYTCKVTTGILINRPITIKFHAWLTTAATSGTVFTVNSTAPTTYGNQDFDLYFEGIVQSTGNVATPSSVNTGGTTAFRVDSFAFSRLHVNTIQGFTYRGLWLDGTGGVYAPQVIQHNTFTLGQVINNGQGIFIDSLDAATSSVQVNRFNIQNVYQSFTNIRIDNAASDSNTFEITAMDNSDASGYGIQNSGSWNTFNVGYTASVIRMEAVSSNNTAYVGNTLATGVSFTDLGAANHLFSAGSDYPTQLGSYIRLDQISPPTNAVSMGNQNLNFVRDLLVTGSSSGTISFKPQAAAGTYNWNWPITAGTAGQVLTSQGGGSTAMTWTTPTVGTVTTVGWTGGLISVANPTTTPAFTVAGTSGGIPYFSGATTWASSGLLAANALVIGGGAGTAPATTTTGTGVLTALGVNVGSAGAFVTFNGALGSPSSAGTIPAFTLGGTISGGGNQINNVIIGTTMPLAGSFTTLNTSGDVVGTSATASTSSTTGATKIAGGLGVAKDIWALRVVALGAGAVSSNLAFGNAALNANTSGGGNIAIGYVALSTNITGNNNVAIGTQALQLNTSDSNTAIGALAGANIAGGNNNTIIGASTAGTLTSGASNILIGSGIDVPASGTSSTLNIGGSIKGTNIGTIASQTVDIPGTLAATSKTAASVTMAGGLGVAKGIFSDTLNVITMANTATTSAVCYNTGTGLFTYNATVGTCTVSDERFKNMGPRIDHALDKLLAINGVSYTWKDSTYGSGPQIGVGAQTVEKVFPELVSTGSDGVKSVDYQRLTAPIIEALRELKADNDNHQTRIVELERRLGTR